MIMLNLAGIVTNYSTKPISNNSFQVHSNCLSSLISYFFFNSEVVENPEIREPNGAEEAKDYLQPVSEAAKVTDGYDMTDNSAYRSNISGSSRPTGAEEETADNGGSGDATVNFDMTGNTAYSSTSFN